MSATAVFATFPPGAPSAGRELQDMTTDARAALIVSVCLNSTPKSLTWLVVETGFNPSQVSRALRLLGASDGCRWLAGKGWIYWSPEAEEELVLALADDVCRSLLGP